jgi:hypothetical protein
VGREWPGSEAVVLIRAEEGSINGEERGGDVGGDGDDGEGKFVRLAALVGR